MQQTHPFYYDGMSKYLIRGFCNNTNGATFTSGLCLDSTNVEYNSVIAHLIDILREGDGSLKIYVNVCIYIYFNEAPIAAQ